MGTIFALREFVEQDIQVRLEWLEKAANQNNPQAMDWLGFWFRQNGDEKAVSYYRTAAELGWKDSIVPLAWMLQNGETCANDLSQAAMWGAKVDLDMFWQILHSARGAFEREATEDLGCNFDQLCYWLGWGLYWYVHDGWKWHIGNYDNAFGRHDEKIKTFGSLCLDFYCATIELQRESIFTFLLFWNQSFGVKDVGVLIGKMVWEEDRRVWVERLWRN
jgi:hypothetical protein